MTKLLLFQRVEHVVELYVEQAFLDYKIKDNMSLQAGLMLIPMGIQNLYHEPPTFNGVERTNVDKYIVPTTWREIGVGINGSIDEQSINYQLMMVNGPLGYDNGSANFSGKKVLEVVVRKVQKLQFQTLTLQVDCLTSVC